MNPEQKQSMSDHDNITTLIAKLDSLKEFVERGFRDLGENYSSRLDDHETRLMNLESSRTKQNVTMSIGIGILTLLTSLLTYHMFK
jgi:hypothetical protein